ncbi:hypothetical protein Javan271_0026 [Streptococcus phage Javan271]|uniref:hypothetical protein n=1 Tax=Streptococcus iniae TaxID=1346 RepID=UPI00033480B1|nr:hypothetical protein [Streptococcus iniae]AGM98669.1 hypothetical protein K710_0895 [Streptococcus iniae SF1]QBX16706.1 hypothetical protein Javan271_0026 [Streptococcus phage Javan271]WLR88568.1 hypothetical protein Q9317_04505 [Streptococcus iniae]
MKNDFLSWLNSVLLGLVICIALACSTVNKENNQLKQRNNHLKTELKSKDQQIKGLSEQVSRQTKRIAELTGNGG